MNRMGALRLLLLVAIAGLSSLGCVAVPGRMPQSLAGSADGVSCRVISAGGKAQTYCGIPEQWREFDRRMALRDAGVTCRNARTPRELCLDARQWARVDRMAADRAQASNMGAEAQNAIAQRSVAIEQMRQQWVQWTGMTYPNLPPPAPRP